MEVAIGKTAVTVTLALLLPFTAGAATPRPSDLEMCRAQKLKDCRRLSLAELDRLRGGMLLMTSIGPIEVTFGITQAIYINNKLVALTQFVAPGQTVGVATPNSSQTQAASAALAALQGASTTPQSSPTLPGTGASTTPATTPSSSTTAGGSAATALAALQGTSATPPGASASAASGLSAAQGTIAASTPVVTISPTTVAPSQTAGLNATLNAAPNGGGASAQGQTLAGSQAAANSSTPVTAGSVSPTVVVNGVVVTPGNPVINVPSANSLRSTVIVQSGPGNIVVPSAADISSGVATIIQNSANNQAIRAVTEMNVSMTVNKAMSSASIGNAVRQGMITSRP